MGLSVSHGSVCVCHVALPPNTAVCPCLVARRCSAAPAGVCGVQLLCQQTLTILSCSSAKSVQTGNTALHCVQAVPGAWLRPLLPLSGVAVLLLLGTVAVC